MNPKRARPGFTLVELVVVLAIISLIVGLAAPRYASASARYRVETAARRVAADLGVARDQARSWSVGVTVSFTVGSAGSYTVKAVSGPRAAQTYQVKLWDDPYRVAIESVDFGGLAQASIDGYGVCPAGAIKLRGTNGWGARLDVDSGGRVTIVGP